MRSTTGAMEGRGKIGRDLVLTHHEIDLLVTEQRGGHPVAGTVDADDLAGILGKAVGREEVDVGGSTLFHHLHAFGAMLMIVKLIVSSQRLVQTHALDAHGAAAGHADTVDLPVQVLCRFSRRFKHGHGKAVLFQTRFQCFKCHIRSSLFFI